MSVENQNVFRKGGLGIMIPIARKRMKDLLEVYSVGELEEIVIGRVGLRSIVQLKESILILSDILPPSLKVEILAKGATASSAGFVGINGSVTENKSSSLGGEVSAVVSVLNNAGPRMSVMDLRDAPVDGFTAGNASANQLASHKDRKRLKGTEKKLEKDKMKGLGVVVTKLLGGEVTDLLDGGLSRVLVILGCIYTGMFANIGVSLEEAMMHYADAIHDMSEAEMSSGIVVSPKYFKWKNDCVVVALATQCNPNTVSIKGDGLRGTYTRGRNKSTGNIRDFC